MQDEHNHHKYPHPIDDEHNNEYEKNGVSLLGELLSSLFNGLFNIIKKGITFLITALFCLLSILDLSRELLLSIYFYFCLSKKSRILLHSVLINKDFYFTKNGSVLIFSHPLKINIQPKESESHFANLEHKMPIHRPSALSTRDNYPNFLHYHVDHILVFLLKVKNCPMFSHRYEVKLTTEKSYKNFKNDILKTKHILKKL